jgi:hypothetical protein
MELTQLAAKPQLVKIPIDDAETVAAYGEAVDFWTWDRQPLDVFLTLSNAMSTDRERANEIIRTLVLDSAGNPVMKDEQILPVRIMVHVMTEIMNRLGK